MVSGVVVVNKPKGITSFKVVSLMKKLFNTKKVGHAGTLDPLATGVLPILINKATKIQSLIQNANKEYVAEFKLGITTNTEDITGNILKTYNDKINVTENEIKNILLKFKGTIQQVPPMYSAVSVNGKRLYNLARQGIEIERKARKVTINKLELLQFNKTDNIGKILINCSKGTYIRTLCADIGKILGFGATMISLERTKTCRFTIDDSFSIKNLENLYISNNLNAALIPIENVILDYGSIFLNKSNEKMFINGRKFKVDCLNKNNYSDTSMVKVFSENNILLGIGNIQKSTMELSVNMLLV